MSHRDRDEAWGKLMRALPSNIPSDKPRAAPREVARVSLPRKYRAPAVVPSFGRGPAGSEKEGIRMLYVFWALLVLVIVVVFLWGFRPRPSVSTAPTVPSTRTVPTAPTLEVWQVALARGDGNDWVKLSDFDKMTLAHAQGTAFR